MSQIYMYAANKLGSRSGKTGNKGATCFATLLQNELNSDVARFISHVQTCPATNSVVAGCKNLLQKVGNTTVVLLFKTQPVLMLRVLATPEKLV